MENMKRHLVAGMLGLAVAGCAQTRSQLPKEDGRSPGPVGMTPVPSIHESINRGTGPPGMSQAALPDPADPRWSGRAPVSVASGPGSPGAAASPGQGSPQPSAAPGSLAGAPGAVAGQESQLAGSAAGIPAQAMTSQAPAMAAGAAGGALSGMQAQPVGPSAPGESSIPASLAAGGATPDERTPAGTTGAPPALSVPSTLARPGGPMPETIANYEATASAMPSPPPGASPGAQPVPDRLTEPGVTPPAAGMPAPAGIGLTPPADPPLLDPRTAAAAAADTPGIAPGNPQGRALNAPVPTAVPADPAVSPSASRIPGPSASGGSAAASQRRGDPLLGPNPDLMPELPPLPPELPTARPAAAAPSGGSTPAAAAPAAGPADAAGSPPPDLGPPVTDPGPPTGDNRPVDSTKVAQMPMPELAPASGQALPAAEAGEMPMPELTPVPSQAATTLAAGSAAPASEILPATSRSTEARRDVRVVRTSLQKPVSDEPSTPVRHVMRETPQIAARVGDDVITCHDLRSAIVEFCSSKKVPWGKLPPNERNDIGMLVLNHLIDRSLLSQEAKHAIKDPKQYDKFMQVADQVWHDEELPPLEYQYVVNSEQLLRDKLKEHGRSLDNMRQTFRQEFLAENFVRQKLKDRLKVELPDLKKYYHEHVGEHEFDRPAQITWRELVVEVGRYPSREDARRKANDLHEKLRRGADFAQLARTESDGPDSSRNQGGLMQTSPGTYAVPAVNEVLLSLPTGRFSEILEGGNSFHIVLVENRRPAGAATFAEVQDKIRSILTEKRIQTERSAFIAKLRQKALITTILDQNESNPNTVSR